MAEKSNSDLPPGFRFHPTDEELIIYYLQNQAMSRPCPVSTIHEVDIYKFDPWQLADKAESGENEWYFFTPRDRKYPNGIRPNRSTVSGYWKATGTDRAIYSETKFVGIKKALVFYHGRPPKGTKTNWIMHEYRLSESRVKPVKQRGSSMRLDDWVLCRIYKKRHAGRTSEQREVDEDSQIQTSTVAPTNVSVVASGHEQQELKFPMTFSTSQLMELDYLGQIPNLFNGGNPFDSSTIEFQTSITGAGIDPNGGEKGQFGDLTTMTMDQIGVLGQQLVANHNHSSVSFF